MIFVHLIHLEDKLTSADGNVFLLSNSVQCGSRGWKPAPAFESACLGLC